ncbi:MAG TPA: iron-sulfur cluster assembly protein [Anaerolineaceae bacterium]|nr:iron-sulfur cluster assembly protein [Anaerolineaceae bacterium]
MSQPPGTNRPKWDAEEKYPELCQKLRQGFGEVMDPELGLSIIQLGLIRNVQIEDESVTVKMILTTPYCPYGPAMIDVTRKKAEEVMERPAFIDFSVEMWDFSMMEEGLGPEWGLYS